MPFARTRKPAPASSGRDPYLVPNGIQGVPYQPGWNVDRAVNRGVLANVWAYRCVMAYANAQARLQMTVREKDWFDGPEIQSDVVDVFNAKSSPYELAFNFRKRCSMVLLLCRQGLFIEKVLSRSGDLLALYILPPGYTFPIPDAKTFVSGYRVQYPGTGWVDLNPDSVIWIREPHPTDPYLGMTPMEAAGVSIETDWFARMYNRSFLANDARPGGALVVKGRIDRSDADDLERDFRGGGPGYMGSGRLVVLESDEGADYVDFATTPRDAQYVQMRDLSKQDILGAFGCPESLWNASGRTFENSAAEHYNWWAGPMLDHLSTLARHLDDAIDPDPKHFATYDLSNVRVLDKDRRDRLQFMLNEVTVGVRTKDEYRAADGAGMEPVGANKLYGPAGQVPVADADHPYQPVEQAAPPAADQTSGGADAGVGSDQSGSPIDGFDPGATDAYTGAAIEKAAEVGLERKDGQGSDQPGSYYLDTSADDDGQGPGGGNGCMVALYPPPAIAAQLAATTGVLEPPDQLHITLAYIPAPPEQLNASGLSLVAAAAVAAWASGQTPLEVRTHGRGTWSTPDDGQCTWAAIDSPGLIEARTALVRALQAANVPVDVTTYGFTAHMTLGYSPAELDIDVPNLAWMADTVTVAIGDLHIPFRLAGATKQQRSPVGRPLRTAIKHHRPRPRTCPPLAAPESLWTTTST